MPLKARPELNERITVKQKAILFAALGLFFSINSIRELLFDDHSPYTGTAAWILWGPGLVAGLLFAFEAWRTFRESKRSK